jgi:hypothetical protein
MNINSEKCQLHLATYGKYKELLIYIYKNTLYLNRSQVLSNIEIQIKKWIKVREKKRLYIYLPQERYGSEHYLYYHFQDILPKHKVINDVQIINPNLECLFLNDLLLTELPSELQIKTESITFICVVISTDMMEEIKNYHISQHVSLYFSERVDKFEFNSSSMQSILDEFIEEINIKAFYPVCLMYKKPPIYRDCVMDDIFIHESLRKDFINIYDDVKNFNNYPEINTRDISRVLPLYVKFKNIPFCSDKDHYLIIKFKDHPHDDNEVSLEGVTYDTEYLNEIKDDLENDENYIIFIFISIRNQQKNTIGHANLCIVNKYMKTYELFEPWGSDYGNINIYYTNKAVELIVGKYVPNYTFIPIHDYCYYGLQTKHGDYFKHDFEGICAILCVLYGVLRVLNPEFSQKEIIDEIDYMIQYPDFGITLRKFNEFCQYLLYDI